VLKNVGLSADLQARLDELRASRQRLVSAQEWSGAAWSATSMTGSAASGRLEGETRTGGDAPGTGSGESGGDP